MKRFVVILLITLIIVPIKVDAGRGCCSHHGGVAGCSSGGRQICADGTLSPTCICTPVKKEIYGCTDSSARNYNSNATKDNGTCEYHIYGCTNQDAKNYNAEATKDDGSCIEYVYGCMDKEAINYNELAEKDDGSCEYPIYGCTDILAKNYNKNATDDDGSCEYEPKTEEASESSDENSGILGLVTCTGIGIYIYNKNKKKKNQQ